MIKEFCAENYTSIPLAIANGANRIELCDNLAVGGTTPSTGVIEEVLSYANEKNVPVMTIIRPRGGDFVYNDIELKIMHTDLIEAKKLGTDGVVIGCLTPSGWLDEEALEVLIDSAEGLQITFHMAFDAIPQERQYEAIDWLVEHGVHRILTHGGVAGTNIENNFVHLKQLIAHADGRIIILPGGGITSENAQVVADTLEVHEVHGTKIVPLSE
ncbi:copper homeostasis protein CutC [Enterococcus mundtii]|uniref:copper homeostasis protein CutC n=1 Tax=Enterococcus TaxID=1350 RepID=UPI00044901C9|nr:MULTISPECIES: copper homeostasis protein CutC [Enterococcus]AZP93705.1 copper homeostasis protein CutC [Enterococcus mundtii]EYT96979.1 copper homeostasis protein CutC [Enterococcus mundtii CRL35]MDA9428228.1 Cytoplasmic copper homeostasis protein cutC [Enterococcus mundtii 1A]MDK4209999.1 copper homeostasis protein CutC [Enterococcus mundtii]MDO7878428.1 copper homeostasis protein CutC [Enterococcus mundtii]